MFVRVIGQWRAIERSPGVLALIKFGEQPARCPDAEVGALLARADRDGIIRLPSRASSSRRVFAPGAKVSITDGPFRGLSGIYQGMSAREREVVLLDLLGGKRPVEIAAGLLALQG
jgi:transcriptional antiterminator RfaH